MPLKWRMRQPCRSHYRNSRLRCNHICLTVITSFLLLLVGCSIHNEQQSAKVQPHQTNAPASAPVAQTPQPAPKPVPTPAVSEQEGWTRLFDGRTLNGWAITDFAGHGNVKVENGSIILEQGVMTGITWTNPLPAIMNYEV